MTPAPAASPPAPRPGEARLAFYLLKKVNAAVRRFDMLRAGDRVAVAVSGGKDSLSLLRLLQIRQATAPQPYALAAVHVLGDATGIIAPHAPLVEWLAGQGLPYRVVRPTLGADEALPLGCQRCAWLRRKALFTAAGELGCNVIAFAHHADDVAQTTLLNLLYAGSSHTLQPAADYFDGRFRLIRPLFFVPENELARFARVIGCPPPPPLCPRGDDSRRRQVAEMLKLLGRDYPVQVRGTLINAGLRSLGDVRSSSRA